MPPTDLTDGGVGNVILYCGLGMIAVGLVITVVGLGDKGFHSLELRLLGPIVVLSGLVLAIARILVCILPGVGMVVGGWGGWVDRIEGDRVGLIQAEVGSAQVRDRTWIVREGDLVAMIGQQQLDIMIGMNSEHLDHADNLKHFHNKNLNESKVKLQN